MEGTCLVLRMDIKTRLDGELEGFEELRAPPVASGSPASVAGTSCSHSLLLGFTSCIAGPLVVIGEHGQDHENDTSGVMIPGTTIVSAPLSADIFDEGSSSNPEVSDPWIFHFIPEG